MLLKLFLFSDILLETECAEGAKEYEGSYLNHFYLHWVDFLDIPDIQNCDLAHAIQYTIYHPLSREHGLDTPFFLSRTVACSDDRGKSKWLSEFRRAERRILASGSLQSELRPSIFPRQRKTALWETLKRASSTDTPRPSLQYCGFNITDGKLGWNATSLVLAWIDRWETPLKNANELRRLRDHSTTVVVKLRANYELIRFLQAHCQNLEPVRIRIISNSFRKCDGGADTIERLCQTLQKYEQYTRSLPVLVYCSRLEPVEQHLDSSRLVYGTTDARTAMRFASFMPLQDVFDSAIPVTPILDS
eukprot:TRINITY_DN5878_c0_g1_i3.p1 TRINITY_DN5878_c0_g1~~TRINITY_DN5878_c0_g1_i3.p1  ORF type:complete len:304 (-),score=33.93 TRINITY_DN5878_c0_g1_i3:40-951(-)